MKIEVLFFAQLRESMGTDREVVEAAADATVDDVVGMLALRPAWASVSRLPLTCAVNEDVVDRNHALRDGDRLALLPPVSGG